MGAGNPCSLDEFGFILGERYQLVSEKKPSNSGEVISSRLIHSQTKPYFKGPSVEISVNTYVDMRMMLGAQRGLYNGLLYPLLQDEKFREGAEIFIEAYMIGDFAATSLTSELRGKLNYSLTAIRKIIQSPAWAEQAKRSFSGTAQVHIKGQKLDND